MIDGVLMRAQGKVVAFLAATLHGAGITPMSEFAARLDACAEEAGGDAPAEAQILSKWAAQVRMLAEEHETGRR